MREVSKTRIVLAYLAVVSIWSTTPLMIQWSGQTDWYFGIAARILISALLSLPLIMWLSSKKFSFHPHALRVYVLAGLGVIGGMTPMYYAAQTMPSGWISLIFGMTPVVTGLLAVWVFKSITLSKSKLLAIILCAIGLMVVVLPSLTGKAFNWTLLGGVSFAIFAVFFHSLSTIYVKQSNRSIPAVHVVAGAAWVSSVFYILLNPHFLLEWPELTLQAFGAIVYLGSFGSLVGFVLYYFLLKHIDAISLGLITVITPVIAILLGYFFNGEPLTFSIIVGAGIILIGLLIYQFGGSLQSMKRLLGLQVFK